MVKVTQKKTRTARNPTHEGIVASITQALNSLTGPRTGPVWNVVSSTTRFTRSGVVSVGSWAWYFMASAMVVVFPIRRAIEVDQMMAEQQMADAQRFHPDSVLPSFPAFGNGAGSSSVPITPHF